ncbi:Methyltransferase domain [Propionibacterium ruminifibrarum]|uniref:Methyltransferase domain n=1 Tax=Propionibacterium ruminifibrarum TaxID=1962131 RepID=A0A375HZD7_9ACTN|nr:class I SAM-dependent methyltransferase [Propionibacterium ruminifibrarum]SPF67842.1 Methyltransferase domain [Propionibacterium ruminifibrarum]
MSPSRTVTTPLSAPEEQRRWRSRVLPALRGTVLDVGAGSGVCGATLDPNVQWLALEPRPRRRLVAAVRSRPHSRILDAPAEQVPLEDASIDAVICSTALCSVADPDRALAEIHRVLRPHGGFVFFEHVAAAPGTAARRVQGLAGPFTRCLDHGCDPCRDTATHIRRAGFASVELETLRTGGLVGRLVPVIRGRALR